MTGGHYATLGVAETATIAEINDAYRRLVRGMHPDFNSGSDAVFKAHYEDVRLAHAVLSDPARRKSYDEARAEARLEPEPPPKQEPPNSYPHSSSAPRSGSTKPKPAEPQPETNDAPTPREPEPPNRSSQRATRIAVVAAMIVFGGLLAYGFGEFECRVRHHGEPWLSRVGGSYCSVERSVETQVPDYSSVPAGIGGQGSSLSEFVEDAWRRSGSPYRTVTRVESDIYPIDQTASFRWFAGWTLVAAGVVAILARLPARVRAAAGGWSTFAAVLLVEHWQVEKWLGLREKWLDLRVTSLPPTRSLILLAVAAVAGFLVHEILAKAGSER